MAEEKKVKIEIESVIEDLSDDGFPESTDKTSSLADGIYSSDGNTKVIRYTETEDGEESQSTITVSDNAVTVKRSGRANYLFVFEEGKSTATLYSVPPYSFDTEIYTRKIRLSLDSEGGELSLIYDMTIGGAKKKTRMKVRVK